MAEGGRKGSDTACWQVRICTLFPEMFPGPLGQSLAGKALRNGIWSLELIDIRDHGIGRHRMVDDTPFGGGPGMVMRPDVMDAALNTAMEGFGKDTPRIYFSPRGRKLDQAMAEELAAEPRVIMIAGRYEGLDQRVIDHAGLAEVSIGDYVLSGGELPALVAIDAVVRLLPGVMGNANAHAEDSFSTGLLEHPLYTQPREWQGMEVPSVLTGGNHQAIADWRLEEAIAVTRARRPDLWQAWQNKESKK
ncbi:tRNA (guanosine(37)-N1)-methyltransferase TrmD [Alphaproteobacteria bacterium LSUCC0684]